MLQEKKLLKLLKVTSLNKELCVAILQKLKKQEMEF